MSVAVLVEYDKLAITAWWLKKPLLTAYPDLSSLVGRDPEGPEGSAVELSVYFVSVFHLHFQNKLCCRDDNWILPAAAAKAHLNEALLNIGLGEFVEFFAQRREYADLS